MDKRKWMAISITTAEALHASIAEKCKLFFVENPLFWEIRDTIHTIHSADDYEIIFYDNLGFAMFKRTRGEHCFDNEHFEAHYTTLALYEKSRGIH